MEDTFKNFMAGEVIFMEGDMPDYLYIINKGTVEISKYSKMHGTVITRLSTGQFFGEMGVLTSSPRTATVKALDNVTAIAYTADQMEYLIENRPGIGARIIKLLVERLKKTTDKLVEKG